MIVKAGTRAEQVFHLDPTRDVNVSRWFKTSRFMAHDAAGSSQTEYSFDQASIQPSKV